MKKAAMFGLDARIALAIFGALSVISGAALYSAIQSAETEKWHQYLEELIKASEQYYLDNGKQIAVKNTSPLDLFISDLATNRENLSTWKGPYFPTTAYSGNWIKTMATQQLHANAASHIFLRKGSTWTQMGDWGTHELCSSGNIDCYEWVCLVAYDTATDPKLLQIFNNLDRLIDNSDGRLAGRVRYNTGTTDGIMYKGLQHTYR